MTIYKDALDRFISKVKKKPSGCWEWQGTMKKNGYGIFQDRTREGSGKQLQAHRFSFEIFHGEIPPGLLVCHHCDNPKCVNPEHLFLGTHKDNTQDMIRKGRQNWVGRPRKTAIKG
jgi:hypothetical protein